MPINELTLEEETLCGACLRVVDMIDEPEEREYMLQEMSDKFFSDHY